MLLMPGTRASPLGVASQSATEGTLGPQQGEGCHYHWHHRDPLQLSLQEGWMLGLKGSCTSHQQGSQSRKVQAGEGDEGSLTTPTIATPS